MPKLRHAVAASFASCGVTGSGATFGRSDIFRARAGSRRAASTRADDVALSVDLEAVRTGDEAAFARVYRAVQPGLVRYLTALVGAEAEDIASETWAQVCRDLSSFRGEIDAFRGFIARVGRNRAIDHLRARARRPVSSDAPADHEYHEYHDVNEDRMTGESAEGLALESLSTRAAVAAIAALPRDQAEAVLLRVVMGLDAAAAGRVLGKRAGAVRTAAYRGLQTLAQRLDET